MDTLAMAEQLKGEYRDAFEKIDVYGMMCNGEKDDYEDRLLNIYDMLLEAQHEDKPVEKIIGKDIEQFCKAYFRVEDKSDKWKSLLRGVASIMLVMFIYSIVDYLILVEERVPFRETMVDVFPIIIGSCAGGLAILYGWIVNKFVLFKQKKARPVLHSVIVLILFLGGIICGVTLCDSVYLQIPLSLVLLISGGYVLIYEMVAFMFRYRKNGTFIIKNKVDDTAKKEFENDISFKATLKEIAKGMAWRFKRIQKKCEKKGQEYTQEDFAKKIRKEIQMGKRYDVCLGVLVVVVVNIPVIHSALTETIMDAIILFAILVIIEFLICRFYFKFNKKQNAAFKFIIDECEMRGITIVEFVEGLE